MHQVLLIIDVQPCFNPPPWLVEGINALLGQMPSVATVERHDESRTPFARQLGWQPAADDQSLVAADKVFIKHGYGPTAELLDYLKSLCPERVLVCGIPNHHGDEVCLKARVNPSNQVFRPQGHGCIAGHAHQQLASREGCGITAGPFAQQ